MATVEADRFIHLARPLASTGVSYNVSNAPVIVNIQPQVCVPSCPAMALAQDLFCKRAGC
jgi:hypothetical protein